MGRQHRGSARLAHAAGGRRLNRDSVRRGCDVQYEAGGNVVGRDHRRRGNVVAVIERGMIVVRTGIVMRDARVGHCVNVDNRLLAIEVRMRRGQQAAQRHRNGGDDGEAARGQR